jgi:hypothetical protein
MRTLLALVAALTIFVAYGAITAGRRAPSAAVAKPLSIDAASPPSPKAPEPQRAVAAAPTSVVAPQASPVSISAPTQAVEGFTVEQVAARVAQPRQRPSIVLLYGTTCPITRSMFADFAALARRHPEIDVLAFATDAENANDIPAFLKQNAAAFAPQYIHEWQAGALTRAMAPLGITVGSTFTLPLLAVRDAAGRVVKQGDGFTDMAAVERSLALLR